MTGYEMGSKRLHLTLQLLPTHLQSGINTPELLDAASEAGAQLQQPGGISGQDGSCFQGCWAYLPGTLRGTDTRQGQPRATGHPVPPSAALSSPPAPAPAQTLRMIEGNFHPLIMLP